MTVCTFIPCSAKIPVIGLIGAYIFDNYNLIIPFIYLIGILAIMVSGLILKNIKTNNDTGAFIVEIPKYNWPSLQKTLKHAYIKTRTFLLKSSGSVFLVSIIIWIFSHFNINKTGFIYVNPEKSLLSVVGKLLCPIFKPLGFSSWQTTVAIISGFAAKENIVSTLAVLLGSDDNLKNISLTKAISKHFTKASALSFIVFNLICVPCIAAVSTMKRELKRQKLANIFNILSNTIWIYNCLYRL